MDELKIPDDLKARYEAAKSILSVDYGALTSIRNTVSLIERIACLEAENARLKAPFDGAVIASLMEADKKRFPNVLDTVDALLTARSKPQEGNDGGH